MTKLFSTFFLRTFYFQEWLHKLVKGKKKQRLSPKHKQFEMSDFKKLFLSIKVSCVCLEQIALGVAVHSLGIFPQVLEAKQYLAKPSTNQQSRTWWTSNCEHPPGLQEAEVAISSGFSGCVLCFILL